MIVEFSLFPTFIVIKVCSSNFCATVPIFFFLSVSQISRKTSTPSLTVQASHCLHLFLGIECIYLLTDYSFISAIFY